LNNSDLTETVILEKLAGTFEQGKSEEALRAAAEADAKKKGTATGTSPKPPRKAEAEEFKSPLSDEEGAIPILQDLFKPSTPTNWVAFGYEAGGKKNDVLLLGKGEGALSQLDSIFDDKAVVYAILGIAVGEGEYATTKFLFICWVGPAVKPLQRARSSQHRVSLYNFVNKYVSLAGEVSAQTKEELTEKKLIEKLSSSRQEAEDSKALANAPTTKATAAKGKEEFKLHNEEEALENIKAVRDDSNTKNWVVFGNSEAAKDALSVLGSGSGGLSELRKYFKDSEIVYALLSVVLEEKESGEDYKTTKYVFISWVGPDSKPLVKARSSQIRLALYNFLKKSVAVSAEIQALGEHDISDEIIFQKIAGSRNL